MTNDQGPERLGDHQHVTLILRLLVDRQGQVVQGEIGEPEGDQVAQRSWVRFRGGEALLQAVHVCLASSHESSPEAS